MYQVMVVFSCVTVLQCNFNNKVAGNCMSSSSTGATALVFSVHLLLFKGSLYQPPTRNIHIGFPTGLYPLVDLYIPGKFPVHWGCFSFMLSRIHFLPVTRSSPSLIGIFCSTVAPIGHHYPDKRFVQLKLNFPADIVRFH